MNNELKALKGIEESLLAKLKANPVFIQLESLRKTIATFENGHTPTETNSPERIADIQNRKTIVPAVYDSSKLTWKERVLFIVNKLGAPGVAEIIREMLSLEESTDKKFITKRVSVTLTQLKADDKLAITKGEGRGNYSKYSIK